MCGTNNFSPLNRLNEKAHAHTSDINSSTEFMRLTNKSVAFRFHFDSKPFFLVLFDFWNPSNYD